MTNSGNLYEVSDNGLLPIMYKKLLKLTKKKTTTPNKKKWKKDINQFTRERQIICLHSFNQQVLNEHPLFPKHLSKFCSRFNEQNKVTSYT